MDEILTSFDAITSSIENEEIEVVMGIVRYREFLEILKSKNHALHAEWEKIVQKTGNLIYRRRRMEARVLRFRPIKNPKKT